MPARWPPPARSCCSASLPFFAGARRRWAGGRRLRRCCSSSASVRFSSASWRAAFRFPPHGVDAQLWLIWEIPLFLAAVTVLLTGAAAGAALLGPRRGVSPWVAPTMATLAAVIAPVVWEAPGRWPWWYTILWVVAIGLLALSRRTRFVILSASAVAALGADDARLGTHGQRARRRGGARPRRPESGRQRCGDAATALWREHGELRAGHARRSAAALRGVGHRGLRQPDRARRVADRQHAERGLRDGRDSAAAPGDCARSSPKRGVNISASSTRSPPTARSFW